MKKKTPSFLPDLPYLSQAGRFHFDLKSEIGDSTVIVGSREEAKEFLPKTSQFFLLSDTNLAPSLYKDPLFSSFPALFLEPGEENKGMKSVEAVYHFLMEHEADRGATLLCVGGGIVSDVGGFIAGTYMRGIECVLFPTTLLSAVDASVGGKTGINFGGIKNVVGLFKPPRLVWCDPTLFHTLPEVEFISGMAEVIKHALIGRVDLFEFLKEHSEETLRRDEECVTRCLVDSIGLKGGVVQRDPTEKNERRLLNFGHTVGHAIEVLTKEPHGMAIAVGMRIACELSLQLSTLSQSEYAEILALFHQFHLPTTPPALPLQDIMRGLRSDKKRERESIHFVLLESIGRASVHEISLDELEMRLRKLQIFTETSP